MELSLRITSLTLTYEDLTAFLEPLTEKYIIALEHAETENRHFQCYIHTNFNDDNKLNLMRNKIKKAFPECKGPGKHSLTRMKNDNLKAYVLKEDPNYKSKGFLEEQLEIYKLQSYEKPKPYKEQLKELEQDYFNLVIQKPYDLIEQYIDLRTEFSLPVNKQKIKDWWTGLQIQTDPKFKKDYINSILH